MNATLAAIASESSLAVLGLSPASLISLGNADSVGGERKRHLHPAMELDIRPL